MIPFAFFAILAVASTRDLRDNLSINMGDLPMQNPDLFEGDMLVDFTDRNAHPSKKWTGNTVPYIIDLSLQGYKSLIRAAMEDYEKNTCIKFVSRDKNETNYLRIYAGLGCYTNVGMIGGQQSVSLGQGCLFKGTILHELGHALGFSHEHNRSDRDDYLTINWDNIMQGKNIQFNALKPNENMLLTKFDYDSIMIYGNTAFSKDGRSKTMVANNGQPLLDTSEKDGLSPSDIKRVKMMYNCQ